MKENPAPSCDVCVVGGAGRVGLPLALVLADSGFKTLILDINETALKTIAQGAMPYREEGGQTLGLLVRGHLRQIALQLGVAGIHVHQSARRALQFLSAADVIDVRVRDHNRLHRQLVRGKNFQDLADIVARVHHDRLAAGFVAEYGAVALQHPHRQDLVDHMPIVGHLSYWTRLKPSALSADRVRY